MLNSNSNSAMGVLARIKLVLQELLALLKVTLVTGESKIYFGFAIADSMFPKGAISSKEGIEVEDVVLLANQHLLTPCLNPSHQATIQAMNGKFGISIEIPEKAPQVTLKSGDRVIVMSPRGLPRLEGRHE